MEKKLDKNLCHNDALQNFNDTLFTDILTLENLTSKKKAIKVGDAKCYGYFLEKNGESYFVQDFADEEKSVLDTMPIRVIDKTETDYNKNVFYFINNYESVKIPCVQKMDFRQLTDTISNFSHTNATHFKLYKIISIVGYVDRINYRVIAERGFGKDCCVNNVRDLVGGVANIYGATMAKLEYSLKHKQLIFNEMGNLKADDKYNMQQFLLAIGAYFNKYMKRSRATEDTQEEYDISKTSLGILYNPPMYYVEKGQEFFDNMFTAAVNNRFIPFYLEGTLNESFDAQFDVNQVVKDNLDLYKDIISTILYFKGTAVTNKYTIPDDITFDDTKKRFERSFLKIADYISEYAQDEEEYYVLVYALYESYKKYDVVVAEANMKGDEK